MYKNKIFINCFCISIPKDYQKLSQLLEKEKEKTKSSPKSKPIDTESKQKIESLERENKKLLDESKIRSTELKNVTEQLNSMATENRTLNAQIKAKKEAMVAIKQKYESLDKEKTKKYELESNKLKKQTKELQNEITELVAANTSKSSEASNVKEKVSKLQMNIKLRDEEIESLKKQLDEQNDAQSSGSAQLKNLKSENEELNERVEKQNKKIKDLKKEVNNLEEENDEFKININTQTEEIKILKQKIEVSKSSDDGKAKMLKQENDSLNEIIEKQKKDIKRLQTEKEEEEENVEKVEKEKRKLKAALSAKDGEITILTHKLELKEQVKELESGTENDQIKKLKENNKELDDTVMKQRLQIKELKDKIGNLDEDVAKEKQHIMELKIQIEQEKTSTENVEKLKDLEGKKYINQVNELEQDKERLKKEVNDLNDLLEKTRVEKKKIAQEKKQLSNMIEEQKTNNVALIQQFEANKANKDKSVESVQNDMDQLKQKYKSLELSSKENDKKRIEEISNKEDEIKTLEKQNEKLKKQVQTEKNHLEAVLRELDEVEKKQAEEQKKKVVKKAISAKHDLSKLNIQIEILNSDVFRMKSLLLLSKYEKVDKKKYYGFLDFAEKDLSDKALTNVFNKLKVSSDKIPASKLAPLLSVIVKLYTLRLHKMKTGKSVNSKDETDRRIIEHLGVWLIRTHSKKTKKSQEMAVLNDANDRIEGKYDVYDGSISKHEIMGLFASWCTDYVECYGRHSDSKLK